MQTLDPRLGNQRRKSMIAKVAQKAMAKKGYASKVGTFGKLANAGKMTRGLRPNRGPGQRTSSARPGGYKDFLDGLSGGPGSQGSGWQGQQQYVNTAPTHADLPDSYTNPVDNTLNPQQDSLQPAQQWQPGDTIPQAQVGTSFLTAGADGSLGPGAPGQGGIATGNPEQNAWMAGLTENMWNFSTGAGQQGALPADPTHSTLGASPNLQQSAPSSPITAPGGLIPLGNGRYYDPATDTIHGTGGRGGV